ncbi:putative YhdH/YhfP family quinone oxidoreductase [Tamilnaduibacter salinus]|uniref:Putative YhdH/YhfP family quinone oxidoreductase n=1 Tax=Tamilnaduibacter salinus TaxID=1484056 RepID=A0A2U1CZI9_9GAMM|nr:YhdH/YhfP family quinone oxidoreductase [Tamilnaduibacter salinus]PVY78209.1 putative YhdH/YhfP family quinone oxidoreductase [Tamilnaduibacter salinus]
MTAFQAWRVHEVADGQFEGRVDTQDTSDLPAGEVLIRVSHSSLNYKDALSASGSKAVTREYPHTPGIDAAGEVVESSSEAFPAGSTVIVTGYDLGMNTAGGFGEYIRVPSDWCIAMPSAWDARQSMIYGTAGLTAGLSVNKLLRMGLAPDQGPVAVTGATGAVGTIAVEILAGLGFDVVAISGKTDQADHLKSLGATDVVGRDRLEPGKKPLEKPAFAGALDTVGGEPLAELLKHIKPGGSVSCCGLVAGPKIPATVFPFILRGVNLLGVDSVEIPLSEKAYVWSRLAGDWACPKTEASARDLGKSGLGDALGRFLKGDSVGSLVLDHSL